MFTFLIILILLLSPPLKLKSLDTQVYYLLISLKAPLLISSPAYSKPRTGKIALSFMVCSQHGFKTTYCEIYSSYFLLQTLSPELSKLVPPFQLNSILL